MINVKIIHNRESDDNVKKAIETIKSMATNEKDYKKGKTGIVDKLKKIIHIIRS